MDTRSASGGRLCSRVCVCNMAAMDADQMSRAAMSRLMSNRCVLRSRKGGGKGGRGVVKAWCVRPWSRLIQFPVGYLGEPRSLLIFALVAFRVAVVGSIFERSK